MLWVKVLHQGASDEYLQHMFSWRNKNLLRILKNLLFLCLFVWFGLNVTFNNISVISWWWLDVAGSTMLTFRVLPHWNIMPQPLWHDILPITLYWHWADQLQLYFLNAERQAEEQLVPFLKSLIWPGQGLNPQPPSHKADALPLSHCAGIFLYEKAKITKSFKVKITRQGNNVVLFLCFY